MHHLSFRSVKTCPCKIKRLLQSATHSCHGVCTGAPADLLPQQKETFDSKSLFPQVWLSLHKTSQNQKKSATVTQVVGVGRIPRAGRNTRTHLSLISLMACF